MNVSEAMCELSDYGTAQNRKVYARHGVGENMFGVSFANMRKVAKQIKLDHELAQVLWNSENFDARCLATMVADPKKIRLKLLNQWLKDLDCYPLTDMFVEMVFKSEKASELVEVWIESKNEWTSTAGWSLLAQIAKKDREQIDRWFEEKISSIASTIHQCPNRTRYSMNRALIAIGSRNRKLAKKALAAARKIGVVEVDHGQTGCKTHDAVKEIEKAIASK